MKNITLSNYTSDFSVQIDQMINTTNKVLALSTRAVQSDFTSFKVMDEQKIDLLQHRMNEVDRATQSFGKTNSQTTSRLMTLTMLNEGPYRMLNQCLAQIEAKRGALKENTFKIKKDIIEIKRLQIKHQLQQDELNKLESQLLIQSQHQQDNFDQNATLEYKINNLKLDIEQNGICVAEKLTFLADSTAYYEAALKEIAIFQESYEEIRLNNNIPEKWDEVDYEKAEVKAHVKTAFRLAVRDIEMNGRLNCATMEYFEQFGINPITAKNLVIQYYEQQHQIMQGTPESEPRMPNIHALNNFLEQMSECFKESYKDAMAIRGLKTHISQWAAYTNPLDPI